MIHCDFTLSLLLLAGLRRIVLENLGHGFLQNSVVLIRIFLKVNGFGTVSAPDQLVLRFEATDKWASAYDGHVMRLAQDVIPGDCVIAYPNQDFTANCILDHSRWWWRLRHDNIERPVYFH